MIIRMAFRDQVLAQTDAGLYGFFVGFKDSFTDRLFKKGKRVISWSHLQVLEQFIDFTQLSVSEISSNIYFRADQESVAVEVIQIFPFYSPYIRFFCNKSIGMAFSKQPLSVKLVSSCSVLFAVEDRKSVV